jgi:hypothetical protein
MLNKIMEQSKYEYQTAVLDFGSDSDPHARAETTQQFLNIWAERGYRLVPMQITPNLAYNQRHMILLFERFVQP